MKRLTKREITALKKRLRLERRHTFQAMKGAEREEMERFCSQYMEFLDGAKTERLAVRRVEEMARAAGFVEPHRARPEETALLWTLRGKVMALARLGQAPPEQGVRLVCAHIDAPRLDLKLHPLYQEMEMAYLKTHYYGGIKKFQWVTRPLALYGVVVKGDGRRVEVAVGDTPDQPVLVINDLLPHLSRRVQDKKLAEAIPGEKLNVLVGGSPLPAGDRVEEGVKLQVLRILEREYGITEEDLVSAELEVVPAGPCREVGLDRAFIGGYGQDDRCCAFAAVRALLDLSTPPPYTAVVLLVDKEEIGSDGNTGAKSLFLQLLLQELLDDRSGGGLLRALFRSRAISADVTAAVDPDYMEVHDKNNNAWAGHGVCLTKYTGARGKYSTNDAHAEYLAEVRRAWVRQGVVWQAGTMGRVDEGGGGTVAKYLAQNGLDVVDAGTPLLSMHSPFEVAHKGDLYMTYRGYRAFFTGQEVSHEDR